MREPRFTSVSGAFRVWGKGKHLKGKRKRKTRGAAGSSTRAKYRARRVGEEEKRMEREKIFSSHQTPRASPLELFVSFRSASDSPAAAEAGVLLASGS